MDWCPVEWPINSNASKMAKIQARQSGKKATRAGIFGVAVLFLMAAVVLGYAALSERIVMPQKFEGVKIKIDELIYGNVPVSLTVDGKTTSFHSKAKNIQGLLKEQGVVLNPEDKVIPNLTTTLNTGMNIRIVRMVIKTETNVVEIPFVTERIANIEMPRGFARKVKVGKNGLQRETWQVRFEDGIEISRVCVSKDILKAPVNGLVQYGTQTTVSRGSNNIHFTKALDVVATAYSYTGYNTASGLAPRPGVIAVDPRVIPLGTRLYVDGYGKGTALDTGGAIKGNRVDLFYDTENEALQWGVRTTKVYVLE